MLLSPVRLARLTMKAVRVNEFGSPSVLTVEKNVPVPEPGKNQILIELKAAGINPVDTYIRAGVHALKPTLPFTPGKDGAGVVKKLGEGVNNFTVGQRVFCCTNGMGTYAEFVLAEPHEAFPLPEPMTFSQGASIGVAYFTAYRALVTKAKCQPGEVVLIHGASGAVGLASLQIARHLGCTVYGTAGTEEGLTLVKEQGADHVFNHRDADHMKKVMDTTGGKGVDVIVEMLADANLGSDLEILAKNARVVVVGCRGNSDIFARHLMVKEAQVMGVALFAASPDELIETGNRIVEGIKEGWVNPIVEREYDMADAAKAHVDVIEHKKGAKGKLVMALGVLLDLFDAHGVGGGF